MSLHTSSIHRRLDVKIKIMGLEAHDLLFVLLFAAIMNLIFGQTPIGSVMVFGVPILMSLILYFVKRNKPDGYLIHYIKFHLESGFLSAGEVGAYCHIRGEKIDGL